jgi:N-formylglutamate deformylase
MTSVFKFIPASAAEVPILISVPHCGTGFPEELQPIFKPELASSPDDTDWFVDQLYDFAPSMGMPMVSAHYSRWVIDLNRDPKSKPLYNDGRIITGLCPTTTFLGEAIYRDERKDVSDEEIQQRLNIYYQPYHQKMNDVLQALMNRFGKVLLWDCHSIRQVVPSIQAGKFPDLILGDADGTSASPGLIETALKNLEDSPFSVRHNHPFKGGYITRHFGRPGEGVHALQLEMAKVNYMDDAELRYDAERAGKMRKVLEKVFEKLIDQLLSSYGK